MTGLNSRREDSGATDLRPVGARHLSVFAYCSDRVAGPVQTLVCARSRRHRGPERSGRTLSVMPDLLFVADVPEGRRADVVRLRYGSPCECAC
jgi:hypothetical protein